MTILHAVRHAPTMGFPGFIGRRDVPIVVPSTQAVGAVLAVLAGAPVETVWSSSLARCADTARAVADALGVPHQIDSRLTEISHGAWEGRTFAEIEATDRARWVAYCSRWESEAAPGGETATALAARVAAWWRERRGTHALIGHAGVVRALRVVVDDLSWAQAMAEAVPHVGEPAPLRIFRSRC